MRLLVIASVFLWSFNGIGQITITNLDFATAGDDVILSTTTDMGIDYSSTGINHVWDFSGLVPESQIGVSYNGMSGVSFLVNVIFGSFAASQYQATYFVANNDLPIDQLGAFLPVNVTDIYQFSKKTTDSITSIGYAVSVSGTEVPFKSDTIETRYKFPLNYGDQYSSRGYSLMDLNPVYNGVLKQYRTRDSEVDGWGNITTPYGSFDVLRVKHMITEVDSLRIEVFGSDTWIPIPIPNSTIYEWIADGEKEPILRIGTSTVLGTETVTKIEYKDNYLALNVDGIEEELTTVIFPNPAQNEIHWKVNSDSFTYTISSEDGKIVQQGRNQFYADISNLAPGIYTLLIDSENQVAQKNFVKK
jgi:hypothetical protein